jgi:hypothetical protein
VLCYVQTDPDLDGVLLKALMSTAGPDDGTLGPAVCPTPEAHLDAALTNFRGHLL